MFNDCTAPSYIKRFIRERKKIIVNSSLDIWAFLFKYIFFINTQFGYITRVIVGNTGFCICKTYI